MELLFTRPFGARIAGWSQQNSDAGSAGQFADLLARHGVLALRGSDMHDDAFVEFLRAFGELAFTAGETPVPGRPELNLVTNVGRTERPRSTFHVDTTYVRRPPAYTALRAVKIPDRGGATLFTDQFRAFDTLPPEVRGALDGRTIRHVVTGLDLGDDQEKAAEHPVFRPHPVTGRTALYLSAPARCERISGMSPEESHDMVRSLFDHSTRPDNVLRHRWEPGDVVMWDNACVMHRAEHEDAVGDREFHRGMVAGT